MSPESWAALSFLKVRKTPQTGFGSNEATWPEHAVSACVVVLPLELVEDNSPCKLAFLREILFRVLKCWGSAVGFQVFGWAVLEHSWEQPDGCRGL